MRHRLLLLLILFTITTSSTLACSCSGPPTFCQTLTPSLYNHGAEVFHARSLGVRHLVVNNRPYSVVDVVVLNVYHGDLTATGDTLALVGQDGINCAVVIDSFFAGKEYLIHLRTDMIEEPDDIYPDRRAELLICGVNYLPVEDGTVSGPIAPGVTSLELEDFINSEAYCMAGPLPDECHCVAQERDLCDSAADLDMAGEDVGILRLRIIDYPYYRPAYDLNGFSIQVEEAVVVEPIVSDDFSEGDTITIRRRYEFGCLPIAPGSGEMIWLYTSVDWEPETVTAYRPLRAIPLVGPCVQRFAQITNGAVETLAGRVSYNDYLHDLAECVPALPTDELTLRMQLTVFPNPATDRLNVTWVREHVERAELLDAQGRVVATELPQLTGLLTMDTGSLPAGIYFLRLATNEGIATRRVVVR